MDSVGNISSSYNFYELKRSAILLSLGEDLVDVDPYKSTFFYIDMDGDKGMITSDSELTQAGRQFHEKGSVKIFASVEIKKDEEEAPSLEWVDEASPPTVHLVTATSTSTSIMTPGTHELLVYIVKLALLTGCSGGKTGDNSKPTNLKLHTGESERTGVFFHTSSRPINPHFGSRVT
jgi:hypothetical protein